jgi:nitrile hydratase
VAKAWTDPAFRARLFENGTAACAELGYQGIEGEYIVVLENTPTLHNVIVCTQCSCTAWPVLGLPPDWYKSPEYRSRVAREPRPVLRELGLELPAEMNIRVWDTTAETRYLVLPLRPPGTDGWSEEQLRKIVTREAMIGVAVVNAQA